MIEGWRERDEKATWRIRVVTPGIYSAHLKDGCSPGRGGAKLRLSVDDQSIKHSVRPTATADQFTSVHVGKIRLKQGESRLIIELDSPCQSKGLHINAIELRQVPKGCKAPPGEGGARSNRR